MPDTKPGPLANRPKPKPASDPNAQKKKRMKRNATQRKSYSNGAIRALQMAHEIIETNTLPIRKAKVILQELSAKIHEQVEARRMHEPFLSRCVVAVCEEFGLKSPEQAAAAIEEVAAKNESA